MRTIILDIDGTILKHQGQGATVQWNLPCSKLPGCTEFFDQAEREGACIILVTARKESHRQWTEDELRKCGVFWDHLIMGVPHGERVIINDAKADDAPSARAIVVKRNEGLGSLCHQATH